MKDDNWHFLYWDEPVFDKKDENVKENEEKEVD